MEQELPPPGWYPDPAGGDGRRYWDGARWTAHVEAAPAVAPIPPPPPPPEPEAFALPVIPSVPVEPAPEPQPFAPLGVPQVDAGAPAEPAPEPQPYAPFDAPQADGGAHGGPVAEAEREPEPELFVPLHIPAAGGGAHGGPAPEPAPEPEKFVPLEVPSFGAPEPAAAAAPLTPSGLPMPGAAVPPPPAPSDPRRKLAIAGAVAALVVFVGFAAVTVLGTEATPSVDGAYEACQEELADTGMSEGEVEFQPEERITIESVDDGVALEFWVDDEASRAFFRCAVDTSGGEPQVDDMWVNLSELMDLVDLHGEARFESVGNSISG